MGDADEHLTKNQKKRQRKAAKKLLDKIGEEKHGKEETVVESKDPLTVLKDKLAAAKAANDHQLARQLRQDIWVLQDTSAGHNPSLSAKEVNESLARISQNYSGDKSAEVDNQETKSNLSPIEKKIQNLEKKLQQIEALRIKLKNGEKLEQTQIKKIDSEEAVREEIEEMKEALASIAITR